MAKKTVLKQNLTKYGKISISILDDEDVIEGEFKSEPEVKVEAKDEPAAEPEKKPRKPKEEKEKQDEPFKPPDPVVSSMPPEPEEPPQVSVNSDQIYSFLKMLTANGYFRDEGIAKAALMWYKGPMEYEPVTTWAEQVKQNMSQGMPLAQAAKSVLQ